MRKAISAIKSSVAVSPAAEACVVRLDEQEPGRPPALQAAQFAWGGHGVLPSAQEFQLAVEKIKGRGAAVALSLPDSLAKVSIMEFETLPPAPADEASFIGQKAAKGLFLKPDECVVSFQKLPADKAVRVVSAAVPRAFVEFFEDSLDRSGLVVERVSLQSMDIFNVFGDREGLPPSYLLVIKRKAYFTFMAVRDNVLEFCRSKDVSGDEEYLAEVERSFAYYVAHGGSSPGRLYSLDCKDNGILRAFGDIEVESVNPASLLISGQEAPPSADILSAVAALGAARY